MITVASDNLAISIGMASELAAAAGESTATAGDKLY